MNHRHTISVISCPPRIMIDEHQSLASRHLVTRTVTADRSALPRRWRQEAVAAQATCSSNSALTAYDRGHLFVVVPGKVSVYNGVLPGR
jgi:hypothetical protein